MFEAMNKLLQATYKALEPSDEEPFATEEDVLPDDEEGWTHQERMNEDQSEEDDRQGLRRKP